MVVRHHGSVHRDDMDGRVCEREDSVRVDLVVVRHHGSVSGNRHSLSAVSDDLVVVRHYGSVSGSTSSLSAVSDDLVVVRHHGSGNRHSLRTQVM